MLQTTLNRYMLDEGVARYNNSVQDARKREEESSTLYGRRLLSHAIVPFSDAIKTWLGDMGKKHAGHCGSAYAPLSQLAPDVSAFVAARGIMDSIGLSKDYARVTVFLGGLIEDEVRFAWLQKHHSGLFRKLDRQLAHCMSYDHKRAVIVHAMNKLGISERRKGPRKGRGEVRTTTDVFRPWDDTAKSRVGVVLIDLLEKSTGLVETVTIREGKWQRILLQATAKTMEWIKSFNDHAEVLDPVWLPTVETPSPWTGPFAGGYSGEGLPVLPMVKRVSKAYLTKHVGAAQMPDVYTAINALQNTPWQINRKVQSVMKHFWDLGRSVGGLPPSDDMELPAKPDDIRTNVEALKAWKQKAARVHAGNAALRSVRLQARKLLNLAQKYANTEKFFFPYQLDFRGRVYTVPTFLTPQGSDLARSLLLFAEGVPMMDDTDAYWLAVYGANLFGKDKITFEERVAWVKSQRDNILAVAQDPLANQWWQTADEPWQFLAWCFEWSGWLTVGSGFKTHLPVCLDGTNNGLQILSMLTRDEVAAKATNVIPSATPADIYGDVARRVVDLMKSESDPKNMGHAEFWLAFGIDRKTTKRPVMVLPYGGTFHSCREYVVEWFEEKAKAKGIEIPDYATMASRCHYLARRIWDGIEFCVGRPRQAMAWLQECADIMSDAKLPILWNAPSGFPVLQAYKDVRVYRVETALGDRVKKIQLCEEIPNKLSRAKQKNGISPNYVHSCDGSALVRTVAICQRTGIQHFAMIHDSYGTHAPRVHEMAAALRSAFVEIFSEDQLQNLRSQLQQQLIDAGHVELALPPVPEFGTLNVSALHESEFFFA